MSVPMTITLGWWLVPLAVTIAVWSWRGWLHRNDQPASGYGAIGAGLGAALSGLFAIVVTLIAWLVWALFR